MKLGLIAFTKEGENLLKRITTGENHNYITYDKSTDTLKPWLLKNFDSCDGIIFVGAIGIAVRLIAPLIKSKDIDPAIIVIDEKGQYVIPILSGHIGGGNRLALELSKTLSAIPIITTATDINHKLAIDTWATEHDAIVDNIDKIKHISSEVLRGNKVLFCSDFPIEGEIPEELSIANSGKLGVMVSLDNKKKPFDITLNIIPKIITLGIGCKKDTDPEILQEFIEETLNKQGISIKAVSMIASIELKRNEKAILDFAEKNRIETVFYSADELMTVEGDFTKSDFVKATTGADNVCERSAMYHNKGMLILQKTAKNGMTIAITKSTWRCQF